MSPTLVRYVTRLYLALFTAVLAFALLIFLAGDLGDRWELFLHRATRDVAALYWNKGLLLAHQLAPVAMLLAAGTTVSVLRHRGEWLAMQSLGVSRWTVVAPLALCSGVLAAGLMAWAELVVTRAGPEVDRLMVHTFGVWGDYRFYYVPQQWFRAGDALFNLRGGTDEDGTMHDVTVLAMDRDFSVAARYDAERFSSLGGDTWRLGDVTVRRFLPEGEAPLERHGELRLQVPGTTADTFAVRVGRPELMRLKDLWKQQRIRAGLGLPTQRFELAVQERFAFPVVGWLAALVAALVALRPERRGHLTLTLVEGLAVTVASFVLLIVARRLALTERLPVGLAAWLPVLGTAGMALYLWRRLDFQRGPPVVP